MNLQNVSGRAIEPCNYNDFLPDFHTIQCVPIGWTYVEIGVWSSLCIEQRSILCIFDFGMNRSNRVKKVFIHAAPSQIRRWEKLMNNLREHGSKTRWKLTVWAKDFTSALRQK